ncbi:hypothetical protein EBZ39_03750 [bacterium]|nr:hypothetical protein [bacterium]
MAKQKSAKKVAAKVTRGRGRPVLPPEDRRTEHITIPLSVEEMRLIRDHVESLGGRPATWCRDILVREARDPQL